jgi:Zn-dependent membrane protease YugP
MFFGIDPMYFLFLAPAMALATWAQWKVHRAYADASQIPPASGMSGAEVAQAILRRNNLRVPIEVVEGYLSDHYDPTAKVLRLSPDVYAGRSVAAMGIAAHEVGHALQDAGGYPLLVIRNAIVPLASWGGNLSWILMLIGFLLSSFNLIVLGIGLFSLTVVFQLVNLPVEFDASARAKHLLREMGITHPGEDGIVRRVLSAAAMTYVAATLTSLLTLAYYVFRLSGAGSSSDEA